MCPPLPLPLLLRLHFNFHFVINFWFLSTFNALPPRNSGNLTLNRVQKRLSRRDCIPTRLTRLQLRLRLQSETILTVTFRCVLTLLTAAVRALNWSSIPRAGQAPALPASTCNQVWEFHVPCSIWDVRSRVSCFFCCFVLHLLWPFFSSIARGRTCSRLLLFAVC